MKKLSLLLAILLVASMCLTACTGDGTTTTNAATTTAAATTSPATGPTTVPTTAPTTQGPVAPDPGVEDAFKAPELLDSTGFALDGSLAEYAGLNTLVLNGQKEYAHKNVIFYGAMTDKGLYLACEAYHDVYIGSNSDWWENTNFEFFIGARNVQKYVCARGIGVKCETSGNDVQALMVTESLTNGATAYRTVTEVHIPMVRLNKGEILHNTISVGVAWKTIGDLIIGGAGTAGADGEDEYWVPEGTWPNGTKPIVAPSGIWLPKEFTFTWDKTPVLSLDFASGAGDVELHNAQIVNDATRGNVLKINGSGVGVNGTSYGRLTTDAFVQTDWSKGMTISMWIQTAVGSETLSGAAPIYSIDMANLGYVATTTNLQTAMDTNGHQGGFVEPCFFREPTNRDQLVNKTAEGKWQLLTVVYDPVDDNVKIYLDGALFNTETFYDVDHNVTTNVVSFFLTKELNQLAADGSNVAKSLTLGSWNNDGLRCGSYEGLIDDVQIYNTALKANEVRTHYEDTKVEQTTIPGLSDVLTVEAHTPVYSYGFDDATAVELHGAEIVEDAERGNVLQVNGKGQDTVGSSYGLIKTDVFKNTDWSKGITISMWVKVASSTTLKGSAPIFSLDIAENGFISVVSSMQSSINTDGNDWDDSTIRVYVDPHHDAPANMENADEWALLTYVVAPNGVDTLSQSIYINGELVARPNIKLGYNGSISAFFAELNKVYSLRLGSALSPFWNFGDYEGMIDDIAIYNDALNPLEVKNLYDLCCRIGNRGCQ